MDRERDESCVHCFTFKDKQMCGLDMDKDCDDCEQLEQR